MGGTQVLWQGQKLGLAGACKYLDCCPCARPAQHGQVIGSYMCTIATQMDQDRAQNDPAIPTLCMYARQMLMCFTNCDVGPTLSKKHGISSSLNCMSLKVLWLFQKSLYRPSEVVPLLHLSCLWFVSLFAILGYFLDSVPLPP